MAAPPSFAHELLVQTLYLLALINPISKVSVLSVLSSTEQRADFVAVAGRSSGIAAAILVGAMVCGDFLLRSVFRVELPALQVSGGGVLVWVGFNALRRGVFFEQDAHARLADVAMVPLACPMIAGPATIAACITLRAHHGIVLPTVAVLLAVAVNHAVMLMSRQIGALLTRFNVLGALIRITGLVVMTIGTQMVFTGLRAFQSAAP